MSYIKEVLEKNEVKFTFEVSEQDWKDAIDQAYLKSKHKFSIEGFRKGKVPRSIIEKMYGVSVFFEDAFDIILPKYYADALDKETEVFPVARPEIDIIAVTDTTLKFTATVSVKPEVTLGAYKGLEIKKTAVKVTKKEVDDAIEQAREKAGAWENISDRPVQKGDMAVIDYSGAVDGVKFEGGTAEKQNLEIGSGMFIPGFEEQVVGMNINDEKDVKVTFPTEYGAQDLAGKEAIFAVKLHEIKVKELPKLDDEFAKDVSSCETLADYQKSIKDELTSQKQKQADTEMENNLIETIANNCKVDIPKAMIDEQIEDMIQEFEYRLQYQGMKPEDYYKYTNSSREDLQAKYQDSGKKNVLMRLVMEAIIDAEKITVTDEEVDNRLKDFAKEANKDFDAYKKEAEQRQILYIKNEIVTNKLLEFLKKNNKFA
ncbi:MAG: trigger factor [Clostridia bacterium]